LEIAQVYGYHGGDKIRSNSQGWEDARVIGERQVLMVAIKGQLYLLPEPGPAKFENISRTAYTRRPRTSNE
jgi:hypothetical protein